MSESGKLPRSTDCRIMAVDPFILDDVRFSPCLVDEVADNTGVTGMRLENFGKMCGKPCSSPSLSGTTSSDRYCARGVVLWGEAQGGLL